MTKLCQNKLDVAPKNMYCHIYTIEDSENRQNRVKCRNHFILAKGDTTTPRGPIQRIDARNTLARNGSRATHEAYGVVVKNTAPSYALFIGKNDRRHKYKK